jgi:hypothetical protein
VSWGRTVRVVFAVFINEEICVCADEGEAGGSEDYPHLRGEEENTLEDSKEDETADGKGEHLVSVFHTKYPLSNTVVLWIRI